VPDELLRELTRRAIADAGAARLGFERFQIKIVGRFVEHQHVSGTRKEPGESHVGSGFSRTAPWST